jgi:hypothetical protein
MASAGRQYGQRFAVPRLATNDVRPGFGEALGGIEKGRQQSVSTTGHRHGGDHFGGRHAGQDAAPPDPPVRAANAFSQRRPTKSLASTRPPVQFRLANQPLAWQHAQQALHAELASIGEGNAERQGRTAASCLQAIGDGERRPGSSSVIAVFSLPTQQARSTRVHRKT